MCSNNFGLTWHNYFLWWIIKYIERVNHFCKVPCVIQQSGSLVGTSSWFEVEKERDWLSILEKLIFSFTCFFFHQRRLQKEASKESRKLVPAPIPHIGESELQVYLKRRDSGTSLFFALHQLDDCTRCLGAPLLSHIHILMLRTQMPSANSPFYGCDWQRIPSQTVYGSQDSAFIWKSTGIIIPYICVYIYTLYIYVYFFFAGHIPWWSYHPSKYSNTCHYIVMANFLALSAEVWESPGTSIRASAAWICKLE